MSLGQTVQMREILLRLGWKEVGPLGHYAYLLNPTKVLKGKLPGGYLTVPVSLAMKTFASGKNFSNAPKLAGEPEWVEIDRFGGPHNAIWRAIGEEAVCATVRNASFLNWKYVDQPGQNFIRMEVRLQRELVGIVILKILDADSTYQYRRAVLVELLVRPSDRAAVWAALRTAIAVAKQSQADILMAYLSCPQLETELKRFGFLTREPNRWLLVSTEGLDSAMTSQLTRIENWYLSMGDSDIDRP